MRIKDTMRVVSFCMLAALLTAAAVYGANQAYSKLAAKAPKLTTCAHKGTDHKVIIKNGSVAPAHIDGKLCDTMSVTNTDNVLRYIAFGRHDEHQPYDGITEKTIEKDQGFTVTMDEVGSYKFHDHLHDEVQGTFTVTR